MIQSPTLQALILRASDIEKTFAVTTDSIARSGFAETDGRIVIARNKLAILKTEYDEIKLKIEKLEEEGAKPKRGPGRPKQDLGDDLLLPCDNDNRVSYIQNLRISIEKDKQAIETAEERVAQFKLEKLGKIAEKERLIAQTEKKMADNKMFSLDDL